MHSSIRWFRVWQKCTAQEHKNFVIHRMLRPFRTKVGRGKMIWVLFTHPEMLLCFIGHYFGITQRRVIQSTCGIAAIELIAVIFTIAIWSYSIVLLWKELHRP